MSFYSKTTRSNWSKLIDAEGWEIYKQVFIERQGLTAGQIQWGNGPTSYPCLVTSVLLPGEPKKLLSAYVSVQDARDLLAAMSPDGNQSPDRVEVVTDQQDAFNLSTLANIQAIADVLINNNLVTEKGYATRVSQHLQKLEQKHQALKEKGPEDQSG